MSRACFSGPWALCWCAPMRNFCIVAQMDQLFEIDARARQEALTKFNEEGSELASKSAASDNPLHRKCWPFLSALA